MQLILKLRSSCNFNCTFCSATNVNINTHEYIPQQIKDLLKLLVPEGLIITGGEPLMVPPSYLIELKDLAGSQCTSISLTTNLKDFYLNPDKWTDFFKRKDTFVGTSFNYGSTRKWDKNTVYTEDMFIKVINLFNDRIGYTPAFISVISDENEDTAIDNVLLAKKMNTICKLNNALKTGRQTSYYPRYKIMKTYLKIIDEGLGEYEANIRERVLGRCGLGSSYLCYSTMRAAYVDNNDKLHYSSCEDSLNELNYSHELEVEKHKPEAIPIRPNIDELISKKCVYCELCGICNGCRSQREQSKLVPEHCAEMAKMKSRLIEAGFKI